MDIPRRRPLISPPANAEDLFQLVLAGDAEADVEESFRAQMLTEMARMSLDDGLVMQIHPGSERNHNRQLYEKFGRDMGADIPTPTNYVDALRPLLDQFGNERGLTIILFTLDESTTAGNWRRWPGTIHACGWGRRGGFTTARKG
jgi:glucuronate isomerase